MSQSQRPRTVQRSVEAEEDQMAPRKVPSNLMPTPLDARLVSPSSADLAAQKNIASLQDLAKQIQGIIASFNELLLKSVSTSDIEAHEDYVSRELSVNSSKTFDLDVLKELGRVARFGYIASDDGTIKVKLNEREDVSLMVDDVMKLQVEHNWRVKKVRISTTSATSLAFRLFLA